jgi:hypothetical protein
MWNSLFSTCADFLQHRTLAESSTCRIRYLKKMCESNAGLVESAE